MVTDVDKRFSASDAYNHPFIQNIKDAVDTVIAKEAHENMKQFVRASNSKKITLTFLTQRLPE